MTRILLIRHGHTEMLGHVLYGRMTGVHLSERGRQESARLARALSERYQIDEIVSSPLERAKETAEAIAAVKGADVLFDEDLQEIDFGKWTGKPFPELLENDRWKLYNRRRSLVNPPAGEFMTQVQVRAWNALQRAAARQTKPPDSTVAVVTHGDVVRGLLMLFLGMPLDHIHRLEISTASATEVILREAYPQVMATNLTF